MFIKIYFDNIVTNYYKCTKLPYSWLKSLKGRLDENHQIIFQHKHTPYNISALFEPKKFVNFTLSMKKGQICQIQKIQNYIVQYIMHKFVTNLQGLKNPVKTGFGIPYFLE